MDKYERQVAIQTADQAKQIKEYITPLFSKCREEIWQQVMCSPEGAQEAHYHLNAMAYIENMINADLQRGKKAEREKESEKNG